jgi:hypothetical protein
MCAAGPKRANDTPIVISGLWGFEFDNRSDNRRILLLVRPYFFSAGINGYVDGLFGTLTPVTTELDEEDHL